MSIDLPPHVRAEPPVVSTARLSAAVHNGERLQALTAEGLLPGCEPALPTSSSTACAPTCRRA